jgi:hypothetical protein
MMESTTARNDTSPLTLGWYASTNAMAGVCARAIEFSLEPIAWLWISAVLHL